MVQTNYEKLKLEIQSLEKLFSDKTNILDKLIITLESDINSIIDLGNKSMKDIDLKKTSVTEMASKSHQLEIKSSQLNIDVKGQEEQVTSKGEKLNQIGEKLKGLETEVSSEEQRERSNKENLTNQEIQVSKISEELDNSEKIYNDKVKPALDEFDLLSKENQSLVMQYKILRKLIEEGYVKDPRYEILKVLRQPGVDTADKLALSSGVDKGTINETLKELDGRSIIQYEESSGKYTITLEFEL